MEWQSDNDKGFIKAKTKKIRRLYVGNIRPRENVEEGLRELFLKSAIVIGKVELVPNNSNNDSCFAFVECNDIETAIKSVDGIEYDGRIIKVQAEKKKITNKRNNGHAKFGSTGWSKPKSTFTTFNDNNKNKKITKSTIPISTPKTDNDEILKPKEMSNSKGFDFYSRCQMDLSKLMEEFGKEDPDWKKQVATENISSTTTSTTNDGNDYCMLQPNGKAPIHVDLVSFGYKYGSPKQSREGWSHFYPLPPIDCRVDLQRAPHYVAKLSGLSYQCKRVLLSQTIEENDENPNNDDTKDKNEVQDTNDLDDKRTEKKGKVYQMKSEEIAKEVWSALIEAIDDGHHGHANPLKMTIFVGSEYGRHRSVVLVELLAQTLRSLLRKNNDDTKRITQPISIGTRHRDVDQNHRDEEAFGKDLRREHDKKKKQNQDSFAGNW